MESRVTFIHALSPLHAGTGQGVGLIDLPIAREKATNLPYLPGSSIKGSLRDELDSGLRDSIFGSQEVNGDSAYSGSIVFTDQKLLCLPVRSLLGTFAWITSPYILERFKRDCTDCLEVPVIDDVSTCKVRGADGCRLTIEGKVILEDLDLVPENCESTDFWANALGKKIFPDNEKWQGLFCERFCLVSDDVLNFLAETATEVTARNKLDDEKKTTAKGALWYEESLPAETILSGLLLQVRGNSEYIDEIAKLAAKPLQFGGSMTIGRGLCNLIISQGRG
jgi:CRISPR-associated protein Cmr4